MLLWSLGIGPMQNFLSSSEINDREWASCNRRILWTEVDVARYNTRDPIGGNGRVDSSPT